MKPGRSRVSTRLYWSALGDAIAWQQTLLTAHNAHTGCGPGARCGPYETSARLLSRYRAARTALARPRRPR